MRAAARAIVDQAKAEILVVDKVNNLEFVQDIAIEVIPATWTPEHVGKRIVEAFETLAKLPPIRGPKVPGNAWPQHVYDWADKLAQEEQSESEKVQRQRDRNRVRVRASAEDLRRMEIVLDWLSELHKADAGLCRVIQRWARIRSLPGRSIKEECRRCGLSHQAFYRLREKGVLMIAERIAGSPVW